MLAPWPPLLNAISLITVPLAAWFGALAWRRHEDWRPRWAALVLASLLASPHVLTYDLLLLAVPLMLVADWELERHGSIAGESKRWALGGLYFSAWPGVFIARLFHVQVSTLAMALLLWQLAKAPRAGPA